MMKIGLDDVIAAISTPVGTGGIGIVRVSGTGAIFLADKIFKSVKGVLLADKKSHTITYGHIYDPKTGNSIDEVLAMVMKSPNTYTRDDVVEFNCHGGTLVVQRTLEALLNVGARLAEPGEFTKRSFLNGRIDLSQAEAVIDLIHAKTDLSRQMAVGQLEGRLKTKVKELRSELLDMIATIEAAIDYPEHDIEEETYGLMDQKSHFLLGEIEDLLETADQGKVIREGLETVILGKPNVGKSSLLNFFLEEDRAIVTDVPGTTRDTVEESINLGGIAIKMVDTAGIRKTDDIVEQMGVEKSRAYAQKADLIWMMVDASAPMDESDFEIIEFIKDKKVLVLLNKIDLEQKVRVEELQKFVPKEDIISFSVKEGKGIEMLTKRVKELFFGGAVTVEPDYLIGNTRHRNALYQAKEALLQALVTIETRMPEDFISMDLQEANHALGEITGDSVDEEIIDRVFTKFCLGK